MRPETLMMAMLALYFAWWWQSHEHVCGHCGGRGEHRDDCSLKEK